MPEMVVPINTNNHQTITTITTTHTTLFLFNAEAARVNSQRFLLYMPRTTTTTEIKGYEKNVKSKKKKENKIK